MSNLKSLKDRTTEEQREIARKGGIASGKKRRERKMLKELLIEAMSQQNPETGSTYAEDVVAAMIKSALAGDTKAFVAVRDTMGEKPVEQREDKLEGEFTIKWSK